MKDHHPADVILPGAFACAGLFSAWIEGGLNGIIWVTLGYFGVCVLTSLMFRRDR